MGYLPTCMHTNKFGFLRKHFRYFSITNFLKISLLCGTSAICTAENHSEILISSSVIFCFDVTENSIYHMGANFRRIVCSRIL